MSQVAKDENGEIFIYANKPIKRCGDVWSSSGFCLPITESELGEGINPKWEDDEPIEVKLKLESPLFEELERRSKV